jgi:hypothetical protein
VRFAFAVAFGVTVTILACSGDDSSNGGSSNSPIPPNGCPSEPCKANTVCLQQPEPACNGTWYCWTDQKWYCQPQDAGGPGGSPPDGAFMEETGGGSPDASSVKDAPGG